MVSGGQLVLPDSQHLPARPPQRAVHQPVTLLVPGKLAPPERAVVLGLRFMLWTAMPETAVHKHRELELGKNEVRLAEHFLIPPPAGNAVSAE